LEVHRVWWINQASGRVRDYQQTILGEKKTEGSGEWSRAQTIVM
jgi:hypothetical protein